MTITNQQDYAIAVMLDDITAMLFDLDLGNKISQNEEMLDIGEDFKISYKRDLISETIDEHGTRRIVSNFYVSGYKNDVEFIKYVTWGEERRFTIYTIEGFVTGMFINRLEAYRKSKFMINS